MSTSLDENGEVTMREGTPWKRVASVAFISFAIATVSGCGLIYESITGPQDRLPDSAPTLAAGDDIVPSEGAGTRTEMVGDVSLEVPEGWTVEDPLENEERDTESRTIRASDSGQGLPAASVHLDHSPPNSVNDESSMLKTSLFLQELRDFERMTLDWPDSREAVYVTWIETVEGREVDCAAIFAMRNGELIMANAFAYLDEGGFEDSAALDVLLSLRLK